MERERERLCIRILHIIYIYTSIFPGEQGVPRAVAAEGVAPLRLRPGDALAEQLQALDEGLEAGLLLYYYYYCLLLLFTIDILPLLLLVTIAYY